MQLLTTIGRSKKQVSRIFLGTASPPYSEGGEQNALLSAMFEAGITAIDTARKYGNAERCLGKWLSQNGVREEVYLLTKCAHPDDLGRRRVNERCIREDLARSLDELKTDYVDALLLHRDDERVPVSEIVGWFNALIREGSIAAWGASNWKDVRIRAANAYAEAHGLVPMEISSPHFSLAEQVRDPWGGGCVSLTGQNNAAAREWYREVQMPVLAYSSLGRGLFSGKVRDAQTAKACLDKFSYRGYASEDNFERVRRAASLAQELGVSPAEIALAWLFRRGINVFAVIGTSNAARMRANIAALSLPLTDEECAWLDLGQPQ